MAECEIEHLYLYDHQTAAEVADGLGHYFEFYNTERPHQNLAYRTPAEVHEDRFTHFRGFVS